MMYSPAHIARAVYKARQVAEAQPPGTTSLRLELELSPTSATEPPVLLQIDVQAGAADHLASAAEHAVRDALGSAP